MKLYMNLQYKPRLLVNSRVKIHKWGDFVKNWPFFVKFIQRT